MTAWKDIEDVSFMLFCFLLRYQEIDKLRLFHSCQKRDC